MAKAPELAPVPPTQSQRIVIDRSPFWIGSSATAGLKLFLPGISERHASISERQDGFYLSTSPGAVPPKLNGRAIAGPTKLVDGQVIELGPAAKWEFVTGEPRAKPAEAEPDVEPAYAEPGRRKWWRWRRRGKRGVGIPVWAYIGLAAVLIGGGFVIRQIMVALSQSMETVSTPPQLNEVEARIYDSLLVEATTSIERGTQLLELGLEREGRDQFAKAVNVFETHPTFGTDDRIRPTINGLSATIHDIYRELKIKFPGGFKAIGRQVQNLASTLGARLSADEFKEAVSRVQATFTAAYRRPFEITGRDHAEHKALYGEGSALDIRSKTLDAGQLRFLIDSFRSAGIRVKDFSDDAVLKAQVAAAMKAGLADRAGTGLHLHIDRFRDRRDRWTVN